MESTFLIVPKNVKESVVFGEISEDLFCLFQNDVWYGKLSANYPDLKTKLLTNSLTINLKKFRSYNISVIRKVLNDEPIYIEENCSFGSDKICIDSPLVFSITIECQDNLDKSKFSLDYSKVVKFRTFVMKCLSLRNLEKVFKIFLYQSVEFKDFTQFNLFLIECMIQVRKVKDSQKFKNVDVVCFERGVSMYQKLSVSFILLFS